MSTRVSLAADHHFHLFQDMADPECRMRLCLRGEAAELSVDAASGDISVTVAIPRRVWEAIRGIAGESDWGWGEDGKEGKNP